MKLRVKAVSVVNDLSLKKLQRIFTEAPQAISFSGAMKTESVPAFPSIRTTSAPVKVAVIVDRRVLFSNDKTMLQVNHDDLTDETICYFESNGFTIDRHRDGINLIAPMVQCSR